MTNLLELIKTRQSKLESKNLFSKLKQSNDINSLKIIAPQFYFFVLSFQDMLRLAAMIIQDENYKKIATSLAKEDKAHERWYISDLVTLDCQKDIEWLFSNQHQPVRDIVYRLFSYLLSSKEDSQKLLFCFLLEAVGEVYFQNLVSLSVRSNFNDQLKYFSTSHQEIECSHAIHKFNQFNDHSLADELVNSVFDRFEDLADILHGHLIKETESILDFKNSASTNNFPTELTIFLSRETPIYYNAYENFHVITDREFARNVLTSTDFSSDRTAFFNSKNVDIALLKDFYPIIKSMMIMSDNNLHKTRRHSAISLVDENWLKSYKLKVRDIVNDLIARLNNKLNFVTDVAKILPSEILANLFEVPEKDKQLFRDCAEIMTKFFGGGMDYNSQNAIKTNTAALTLKKYFTQKLLAIKSNLSDDFLSLMVKSQLTLNLSDDELISQAIMMLVAGQVSTTDQLCNDLFLLLSYPEVFDEIKSDIALLPNALDEFKRFDPSVTFLFRVANKELTISNHLIKKGEALFISNHCVNRDFPQEYKPNQINIKRKGIKHFAFGFGAHYCLGAALARMQAEILFESMITSYPKMKLGNDIKRDHYSVGFSGFEKLPLILS